MLCCWWHKTFNTQGLEQSSFCGSPGQRLLLSRGPPPSQQGEVVTPRLKGREMYGGGRLLCGLSRSLAINISTFLWLILIQVQWCLVLAPHFGETECYRRRLILPHCGQDRCAYHVNSLITFRTLGKHSKKNMGLFGNFSQHGGGGGSSQFPKLLLFYHSPKKPLKTP